MRLSGIQDALNDREYVECIKHRLDFDLMQRLDTAFPSRNAHPAMTWDNVTKEQLHEVLRHEFWSKETDVSSVLLQFGPSRLKKTP